jgi:hypothetical protein
MELGILSHQKMKLLKSTTFQHSELDFWGSDGGSQPVASTKQKKKTPILFSHLLL